MDADDAPVGRILSRREVMALFGGASVWLLTGCNTDDDPPAATSTGTASGTARATGASAATAAGTPTTAATAMATPDCVVVPELTEGPYFVDERLNRSDIRADSSGTPVAEGTPLTITLRVGQLASNACSVLAGALVDVWHCDAAGAYSDVSAPGFDTSGQDWLRGQQETDAGGRVTFTTIYPGWYQGRAVHIHFKVRSGNTEFTSQWFFDESLTDVVHTQEPYAGKGVRTLLNEGDGIYRQAGDVMILRCEPSGEGYAATFDVAVQA